MRSTTVAQGNALAETNRALAALLADMRNAILRAEYHAALRRYHEALAS